MLISRKFFSVLISSIFLLFSLELYPFIIVLKNGKTIEVEKYYDLGNKIKLNHQGVTLYISKQNIEKIEKSHKKATETSVLKDFKPKELTFSVTATPVLIPSNTETLLSHKDYVICLSL